MSAAERSLYDNHRCFLAVQRGPLTRHAGFDVVHGDIPAFQIAMLHEAAEADEAARRAAFVFAPPWAHPGADAPAFAGREHQLTHMSLPPGALGAPAPVQGLVVERVATEADLRAFTDVQAAGFAPDPAGYDTLFGWMWDKNLRSLGRDGVHFYCLRRDSAPASVLLTVESEGALGIYAVATPPALRRRGLSSHLLAHVCAAAARERQICLQVMRGSDAERLYAKLGFVERFVVDVFKSARRA